MANGRPKLRRVERVQSDALPTSPTERIYAGERRAEFTYPPPARRLGPVYPGAPYEAAPAGLKMQTYQPNITMTRKKLKRRKH